MISKITFGTSLKGDVFCLQSAKKSADGSYAVTFTDKSGKLAGIVASERWVNLYAEYVGGAVSVNGIVVVGEDNTPLLKVRSMAKAAKEEYNTAEVFDGISKEVVERCIASVKQALKNTFTEDTPLLELIKAMLNRSFKPMASLPASVGHHGKYLGGALVMTEKLVKYAEAIISIEAETFNNVYPVEIDKQLLIGACCLAYTAIPEYVNSENTEKMSLMGLQRGYGSLLQEKIVRVADEKHIELDEETLAKLLNVLCCSIPMKSGIRSTTIEGHILADAVRLVEGIDLFSAALATQKFEDGEEYAYLKRIGYIVPFKNDEEFMEAV